MRLLALAIVALLIAGCTGDGDQTSTTSTMRTCPGGEPISDNNTGDPEAVCPRPAPPTVAIRHPADLQLYKPATFEWTILLGNHSGGHSMLTSIRVATSSVPDTASLAGPETYGTEVTKKEHQEIPVPSATFTGSHTFTKPGSYYARAYALIQANDINQTHTWSNEIMLVVLDVIPTGNNTIVTHSVGNAAGTLTPNPVNLTIGDGLIFKNDDLTDHVFTPASCADQATPVTVARMSSSPVIVFRAPGTCTFTTDDVQPKTLTVNVRTSA